MIIDSEGKSEATDEEWKMWHDLRRAIAKEYYNKRTNGKCEVEAVGPLTCEVFRRRFQRRPGEHHLDVDA